MNTVSETASATRLPTVASYFDRGQSSVEDPRQFVDRRVYDVLLAFLAARRRLCRLLVAVRVALDRARLALRKVPQDGNQIGARGIRPVDKGAGLPDATRSADGKWLHSRHGDGCLHVPTHLHLAQLMRHLARVHGTFHRFNHLHKPPPAT